MLKNKRFAGMDVITQFGKITYDDEGVTHDLTREQAKVFLGIEGYELVEEDFQKEEPKKKEAPKKETKKPKQEPKEKPVAKKLSKKELETMTVAELDKLADKEGYKISDGVKREKIKDILKAQK